MDMVSSPTKMAIQWKNVFFECFTLQWSTYLKISVCQCVCSGPLRYVKHEIWDIQNEVKEVRNFRIRLEDYCHVCQEQMPGLQLVRQNNMDGIFEPYNIRTRRPTCYCLSIFYWYASIPLHLHNDVPMLRVNHQTYLKTF